ncbi:MAG: 50S ribosomal protein L25 [Polyangiaceae bacterium]
MSASFTNLAASARTAAGKGEAVRIRRSGQVPAVAYGRTMEATPIAVAPKEVLAVLTSERGRNSVIKMNVAGVDRLLMIRDYTYHPVTRSLEHVDFVEVKLEDEINVEIPLIFTGKPIGVTQGGIIRQVYRTIPVRSRPDAIPVKVEIDISHLELGEHVATKDLKLDKAVTPLLPPEQTLIAVVVPDKDRSAEDDAAAAAAVPGAAGAAGAAPAAGAAAGAAGAKPAAGAAAAAPAKDAAKKK